MPPMPSGPEYRKPSDPVSFEETHLAVRDALKQKAQLLQPIEYSKDLDSHCEWRIPRASLPLADKGKIFSILGYV